VAKLGAFLAGALRDFRFEVIIGLPTLGLSLAPIVAQKLEFGTFHDFIFEAF
jgi:adenine/guanine phosphoribosyltransferase-like PRPP-binding protein